MMTNRRSHSRFRIQRHGIAGLTVIGALVSSTILTADDPKTLEPSPVFFHVSDELANTYTSDGNTSEFVRENKIASECFHAMESTEWPGGLIPIFGFFTRGEFRLSRTPKTGWENLLEPIFFALPPVNETNAAPLTGMWSVSAINPEGHTDQFNWELTTDGSRIAGRFDLNTDYRFATISRGAWDGSRLSLKVDHINDHFELTGRLAGDKFSGTWRKLEEFDGGRWTAWRTSGPATIDANGFETVPLHEWTHRSTGERSYSTDPSRAEANLLQSENPICRVWIRTTPSPDGKPLD